MDQLFRLLQGASWIGGIIILAIALLVIALYFKSRYKIADATQALVVTGDKKGMLVYSPGAGAFVPPMRHHQFFNTGIMTVRSDGRPTQTSTQVPVIVEWTGQIAPKVSDKAALERAVHHFAGYTPEEIEAALQETLAGEIRAAVATMTPGEVVTSKEKLNAQVTDNIQVPLDALGYEIKSLNFADVGDPEGHYINLAAEDREGKRKEAANIKATADKDIAVAKARADEEATAADLARQLADAERQREVDLRQSAIKSETGQARVNAEYAEEQQRLVREKEQATNQGEVAVEQQKQAEAAAIARRAVDIANAQTDKEHQRIAAEAAKEQQRIAAEALAEQSEMDASANAIVARKRAEGEAEATKARAAGEAEAAKAKAAGEAMAAEAQAAGEANATNLHTEAEAKRVRETGLAEAEVVKAQGEAEAAAILERGKAEAEAQRLMAEALAANEGANLQVTLAQIESTTRIQVATAMGTAMHEVGTNATFIDMGGDGQGGGLLGNLLGGIPELMKVLDVKSQALNGGTFGETVGKLREQTSSDTGTEVINGEEISSNT